MHGAEVVPAGRPDAGECIDAAGLVDAVLDLVLGDVVLGAPAGDGLVLGRVVQGVVKQRAGHCDSSRCRGGVRCDTTPLHLEVSSQTVQPAWAIAYSPVPRIA